MLIQPKNSLTDTNMFDLLLLTIQETQILRHGCIRSPKRKEKEREAALVHLAERCKLALETQ